MTGLDDLLTMFAGGDIKETEQPNGEWGKQLRFRAGWTDDEMAFYLGVTTLTLSRMEKSEFSPTLVQKLTRLEEAIERKGLSFRLLDYRVRKKLTQTELGAIIGVEEQSLISALERGELSKRNKSYKKIQDFFDDKSKKETQMSKDELMNIINDLGWDVEDVAFYLILSPAYINNWDDMVVHDQTIKRVKILKSIKERGGKGLELLQHRVKNRLSQSVLAKQLNVGKAYISNFERLEIAGNDVAQKKIEQYLAEQQDYADASEEVDKDVDIEGNSELEYYKANAEMWKEYYFEAKSQWMVDNLTRELGLYSSIGRPTDSVYSWELNSNRATQTFDRCKLLELDSILWEVATEVDEWAYELDEQGERTGKRTIAPLLTMEAFTKTLMIVDDEIHRMGLIPMHNGSQVPIVETDNWTIMFYNQEDFEELAQ